LSPGGDEFWHGDFLIGADASASGSDNTKEIQSLNLQGKDQKSGLNWLYLAMVIFVRGDCVSLWFH
jgi:hypothetical protein